MGTEHTESTEQKPRQKKGFLQYLEVVTGSLEDKRRWRQYKARVKALPANFRTVVDALERYLMHVGPVPADGATAASMWEDLIDLFEQSAADGTPIRAVVGEDPLEFVEAFVANYADGGWISRERKRLSDAIDSAEGEVTENE